MTTLLMSRPMWKSRPSGVGSDEPARLQGFRPCLGTQFLLDANRISSPIDAVVGLARDNGFTVSESDFQDDAHCDKVARWFANSWIS